MGASAHEEGLPVFSRARLGMMIRILLGISLAEGTDVFRAMHMNGVPTFAAAMHVRNFEENSLQRLTVAVGCGVRCTGTIPTNFEPAAAEAVQREPEFLTIATLHRSKPKHQPALT